MGARVHISSYLFCDIRIHNDRNPFDMGTSKNGGELKYG